MIILCGIGYNELLRYNQRQKEGHIMSVSDDELGNIVNNLNADNRIVPKLFVLAS